MHSVGGRMNLISLKTEEEEKYEVHHGNPVMHTRHMPQVKNKQTKPMNNHVKQVMHEIHTQLVISHHSPKKKVNSFLLHVTFNDCTTLHQVVTEYITAIKMRG
jgi:hypothetical protein